jgi:hypothetical protein
VTVDPSIKIQTAALEETIGAVVAPYLGDTMARAAVRGHYSKLGITGSEVDAAQIQALVGKIKSGLNVFVGQEKATTIVAEILKAVEAMEASS